MKSWHACGAGCWDVIPAYEGNGTNLSAQSLVLAMINPLPYVK
jgi:hypothetical protein